MTILVVSPLCTRDKTTSEERAPPLSVSPGSPSRRFISTRPPSTSRAFRFNFAGTFRRRRRSCGNPDELLCELEFQFDLRSAAENCARVLERDFRRLKGFGRASWVSANKKRD